MTHVGPEELPLRLLLLLLVVLHVQLALDGKGPQRYEHPSRQRCLHRLRCRSLPAEAELLWRSCSKSIMRLLGPCVKSDGYCTGINKVAQGQTCSAFHFRLQVRGLIRRLRASKAGHS